MARAQENTKISQASMDAVFRAISDSTRRQVLERLSRKPSSVSELAAPFKMALPSFLEHLKMLERVGLVSSRKTGRVRTYTIVPERLKLAETWLEKQRRLWETRFDQLDAYLVTMKENLE